MSEELDRFLLERKSQPTATTIGQWMESIFGAERAALKKSISQGDNVEATLHRLKSLDGVAEPSRRRAAPRAVVDELRVDGAGSPAPAGPRATPTGRRRVCRMDSPAATRPTRAS